MTPAEFEPAIPASEMPQNAGIRTRDHRNWQIICTTNKKVLEYYATNIL